MSSLPGPHLSFFSPYLLSLISLCNMHTYLCYLCRVFSLCHLTQSELFLITNKSQRKFMTVYTRCQTEGLPCCGDGKRMAQSTRRKGFNLFKACPNPPLPSCAMGMQGYPILCTHGTQQDTLYQLCTSALINSWVCFESNMQLTDRKVSHHL